MSIIPGPNVIYVYTGIRLPAQFATDNGVDKVVTVEAGNAGPRQTWYIQHVADKLEGVYTITAGPHPPKIGTPGFRRHPEIDNPTDVINSPLRGEWFFVPVDVKGLTDVFEIHPVSPLIGVEELLATDKEDKVVIKTFPIVEDPAFKKPAWVVAPVNKSVD